MATVTLREIKAEVTLYAVLAELPNGKAITGEVRYTGDQNTRKNVDNFSTMILRADKAHWAGDDGDIVLPQTTDLKNFPSVDAILELCDIKSDEVMAFAITQLNHDGKITLVLGERSTPNSELVGVIFVPHERIKRWYGSIDMRTMETMQTMQIAMSHFLNDLVMVQNQENEQAYIYQVDLIDYKGNSREIDCMTDYHSYADCVNAMRNSVERHCNEYIEALDA